MHSFIEHVNPYLGKLLSQLKIDKVYKKGSGCYLYDEKDVPYLDFLAQYGALPFGYNHPKLWDAINSIKNENVPSFVQPSYLDTAGKLAKKLVELSPGSMQYVTFTNSGTESVEAAIKLARSYTRRMGILSAVNGFHGKTLGALSATSNSKYQEGFGAPADGFSYVPYGDISTLYEQLKSKKYAAFIVEPIQGEGGMIEPPPAYLAQAQKVCNDTNTLFIVDEIQTGLGRTGEMFACNHENIEPDILLIAKALSGGMIPIGACITNKEIYHEDFAIKHTSTYAGNSLACAVALATLEMLEDNDFELLKQVKDNGLWLKEELVKLQHRFPSFINNVSGRGYMLGVQFGVEAEPGTEGLLARLGQTEALAALVISSLLNAENVRVGYTLNNGGILRVEPPLIASREECSKFIDSIFRVMEVVEEGNTAIFTAHITGYEQQSEKVL